MTVMPSVNWLTTEYSTPAPGCCFPPQMPTRPGLDHTEAGTQELSPGLPRGQQEPSDFGYQRHLQVCLGRKAESRLGAGKQKQALGYWTLAI